MSLSKLARRLRHHIVNNAEWFVISVYWICASTFVIESYVYEKDLVTKWLIVALGCIPFVAGLRNVSQTAIDRMAKIQLRWVVIFSVFLFFASVPLVILGANSEDSIRYAESQIIVGAPMFGLAYHFLSVANTILPYALRLRSTIRKSILLAVANKYMEGAACISLAAVLLFIVGVAFRSQLTIQSSIFSIFLLKIMFVLIPNSLFIFGFFWASKFSRWYET